MIMWSIINEPLIRRRWCIKWKNRSRKCMSIRRRINIDSMLICWYFQGFHILESAIFQMTISPQKNTIILSALTFCFSSFVTIESMNLLRGFGTLALFAVASCCLFELLALTFYCATNVLIDVPMVLITPICKSLSCSLIKKSQNSSRESDL